MQGRLHQVYTVFTDPKPYDNYSYQQNFAYDNNGSVYHSYGSEYVQECGGGQQQLRQGWGPPDLDQLSMAAPCLRFDEAASYYGADQKLRAFNRHIDFGSGKPGSVFEEYRYDALGRRVAMRSRATSPCTTTECNSYIERTV